MVEEKFILVWTIDGETTSTHQAKELLRIAQAWVRVGYRPASISATFRVVHKSGCGIGVSLDSQPFKSNGVMA
jgi:hypothetical protein